MTPGLAPINHDHIVAYWNTLVYGVCLYLLGFGIWKSLLIMPIVLVCVLLNYGGRWVLRGGFGLLVVTLLVMVGVLPPVSEWQDLLKQGGQLLCGKPEAA